MNEKEPIKNAAKNSAANMPSGCLLFFGVILPVIALVTELTFGICGDVFFDPIPTDFHILLFAFVPAANLLMWIALGVNNPKFFSKLGLVNGLVIGITFPYVCIFLPILPISIMLILAIGIGLLSFAPLGAFCSAIVFCRHSNKISEKNPTWLWGGIALGIGLLFLPEAPTLITNHYMNMAASEDTETERRGIMKLRYLGNEEIILRMCYGFHGAKGIFQIIAGYSENPYNMESGEMYITESEARKIYYQVTGTPFNEVPQPVSKGRWSWQLDFDRERGGENVAGKVRGLSLNSSRIDGFVYSDAGNSYLEWTMIFRNTSRFQQEARALILLPPGGVVSRLTLWIKGEEREAAFSAKRKVREAYQRVVSWRRDPVLVTAKGTDRVLAQCFPVPPDGGEMKIRIGITAPLHLEYRDTGKLILPCFSEYNFNIMHTATTQNPVWKETKHSVWIESAQPISASDDSLKQEHPEEKLYAVRGMIKNSDLSEKRVSVYAARSAEDKIYWTPDPADKENRIIRQVIQETEADSPSRVILVVDGSVRMRKFIPDISAALSDLPENIEFGLIAASDMVESPLINVQKGNLELFKKAGTLLRKIHFVGGQNNITPLAEAWDMAAEGERGAVVWIHGNQPVLLQDFETLNQRWERRPDSVKIFDIQVENGPNRLAEEVDDPKRIQSVPYTDKNDLKMLFSAWSGKQKKLIFFRERLQRSEISDLNPAGETSSHLARLWAYNQILNLYPLKEAEEALNLAELYQLVTPVSGAVVLESEDQYKDAELTPIDPDTAPKVPVVTGKSSKWVWNKGGKSSGDSSGGGGGGGGIPEPATIWLISIGIAAWGFCRKFLGLRKK